MERSGYIYRTRESSLLIGLFILRFARPLGLFLPVTVPRSQSHRVDKSCNTHGKHHSPDNITSEDL